MSVHLLGIPALVPAGGLLPAGPAGTVPAVLPTAGTVVPAHPDALVRAVSSVPSSASAAGLLDGAPVSITLLRLVLLTALATVAGIGLLRPVAGPPVRAERVVAVVAALAATGAAVAAVTWSGSGSPGWTLGLLAVVVAIPVLLGTRAAVFAVFPAVGVTAALAVLLGSARPSTTATVLDAGYAVAAVVLAGAALHLFAHRVTGDGAAVVRPVAVAAGVVATALATAQLLYTGPFSTIDLAGTGYGRAALVALAAPAVVTVLLLAELLSRRDGDRPVTARARRRAAAVRERGRTAAAVVAALGVAATSVLAALPTPAPDAEPGRLLARGLDLGSGPLTLVVTPMRPGPNLVQLTGPGVLTPAPRPGATPVPVTAAAGPVAGHGAPAPAVGGTGFAVRVGEREVPFTTRTGAPGGWAMIDVPPGTDSLTVQSGGAGRVVPIDVGTDRTAPAGATGADGPECASAALGAVVAAGPGAGTVADCPSESLRPQDERTLRSTVRSLAGHGAPGLALAADASPRSRAAADTVRSEAQAVGLPILPAPGPDGALVVVSGWQSAIGSISDVTVAATRAPTALGGIYLAPWLLTGAVLQSAQSALLPLSFGPQEPLPQRYVRALAVTAPGSAPSRSGLLAWAREAGEQVETAPSLFGAAPVQVPMGDAMAHEAPNVAAWFPDGAVVQIGGPLDAPAPAGPPPAPTP